MNDSYSGDEHTVVEKTNYWIPFDSVKGEKRM